MKPGDVRKAAIAGLTIALLSPSAGSAAPAAPHGDAYQAPPGGHFDYFSRCIDEHLSPSDRLRYCRQVINNGRGIKADDEVLLSMAADYREDLDFGNALDTLDKVLTRETSDEVDGVDMEFLAKVYAERGMTHLEMKQYDDAIADATKALSLMPDDARFFADRCRVRVVAGKDLKAALADCDEALKRKPDLSSALDSKALADLKLSDYPAALADCEAALKIDPKSPSALYLRGFVRRQTGDAAAGNADIVQALHENPRISAGLAAFGVVP